MIVHRLDMATSGCVIMARTDAALKDLNRQVYYSSMFMGSRFSEYRIPRFLLHAAKE